MNKVFHEAKMLCCLTSIHSSVSSMAISTQYQIHSTAAAIFIELYMNHQVKTYFQKQLPQFNFLQLDFSCRHKNRISH